MSSSHLFFALLCSLHHRQYKKNSLSFAMADFFLIFARDFHCCGKNLLLYDNSENCKFNFYFEGISLHSLNFHKKFASLTLTLINTSSGGKNGKLFYSPRVTFFGRFSTPHTEVTEWEKSMRKFSSCKILFSSQWKIIAMDDDDNKEGNC